MPRAKSKALAAAKYQVALAFYHVASDSLAAVALYVALV
jgi:hypothetical protein